MAFFEFFKSKVVPAEAENVAEAEATAEKKEEQQKFGEEIMAVIDQETQQLVAKKAALEKQIDKLNNGKKGDARTQKKHAKQIGELTAQVGVLDAKLKQIPADVVKRYETSGKLSAEELSDLRTEYGLNEEKPEDIERTVEEVQMNGGEETAATGGATGTSSEELATVTEETASAVEKKTEEAKESVEEATEETGKKTEEAAEETEEEVEETAEQPAEAEKSAEAEKPEMDNISEVIARMERQKRNLEKRQDAVLAELSKKRPAKGKTKAELRKEGQELGRQIEEANDDILEFRKQAASGMIDDLNTFWEGRAVDKYLSESEKELLQHLQGREQTRSVQIQIDTLKQYAQNRAARAREPRNEPAEELTDAEKKQVQDEKEITILRASRQLNNAKAMAKQYKQQLDSMSENTPRYEEIRKLWREEEERAQNQLGIMREANGGKDVPGETIDAYKANSAKVWGTPEYGREKTKQRAAEIRANKVPKMKEALGNVKRRALAGIMGLIATATLAGCSVKDVQNQESPEPTASSSVEVQKNTLPGSAKLRMMEELLGEDAESESNRYEQAFENGFTQDLSDFMSDKKTEGRYAFGENWSDLEGNVEGTIERFVNSLDSPLRLTSDLSCYPEIMAKCGFAEGTSGREMLETMYNSSNGGDLQKVATRELERIYRSQDGYETTITFFRGAEGDRIISDWGTVGDFTDESGNVVKTVDGRDGLKATYHDYSVIEVDGDDVFVQFETVLRDKDGKVIGHWVKINKLNCNQDAKFVSRNTPLTPYGPNGNPETELEQGSPEEETPPETEDDTPTNPSRPGKPGQPNNPVDNPPSEDPDPGMTNPPVDPIPDPSNPVVEKETPKNIENLIDKANLGKGENNNLDQTKNIDTMTNEEKNRVGDGQIKVEDITGDKTGTYEETVDPTKKMDTDNKQHKEENSVTDGTLTQEQQDELNKQIQETQKEADEMKNPENRPSTKDEVRDFYDKLNQTYNNGGSTTESGMEAGGTTTTQTGGAETSGGIETGGSTTVETGGNVGNENGGGTASEQNNNPVDLGGGNLGGNLSGPGNSGLGEPTGEPGI